MPDEQHFPAGFTMQPGNFDPTSEHEFSNHSQSVKTSEKYQQLHYFHEEEQVSSEKQTEWETEEVLTTDNDRVSDKQMSQQQFSQH